MEVEKEEEKEEVEFFDTSSIDGEEGTPNKSVSSRDYDEVEEVEGIEDPDADDSEIHPLSDNEKTAETARTDKEKIPDDVYASRPTRMAADRRHLAEEPRLSRAPKEAFGELGEEERQQAEKRIPRRRDRNTKRPSKSPTPSPNFFASILKCLYRLVACCNPLVPPLRKRTSRSSTRERDIPQLSELREADDHVVKVYREVESIIKEHYLRATGGGDFNSLKFSPVSYKILRSGGFHYFIKLKVNKGPEYVHAQLFKAGRSEAILIGDLGLNKTKTAEIRQF